ncbi:S-adenosyl-l-methionine hydroxide adenosyltransferase family protein [Candidatus Bathyarchaeota archaeon]|nr:S-adenosyl-l-methionine hydroxide adenosyltransferase family protein [Candidatus Bathyarchaeota archaeon]
MARSIITLTTDFGLRDPYVAEMKAVILGISPKATIVDISHEIEKFNIRMGTFILASASPYFPEGTIHVAVVDPSVGTRRRPILLQTKHAFYVGPDNGVLVLAAENQDICHIYKITNQKFMLPKISGTFHGRDIFAPTAAHLANGIAPEEFGPEIRKISTPDFAKVVRKENLLVGEVMHIDNFGNIITNFSEKDLQKMKTKHEINVKLKNTRLKLRLCKAYAEVEPRQPIAVIGSHNFFEISLNQRSAADFFKIESGNKVTVFLS